MSSALRFLREIVITSYSIHYTKLYDLFNSLGIRLRKARLFDAALKFYERAATLAPDDENIYHNMARALFEKGEMKMAMDRLKKSLDLNPELRESRQFVRFLRRRYLGPSRGKAHVYRKPFED